MNIMGKGVLYTHLRRCDYCSRPVKYGYLVREGPTHGFFCGRGCFTRAMHRMTQLKKEKGIE